MFLVFGCQDFGLFHSFKLLVLFIWLVWLFVRILCRFWLFRGWSPTDFGINHKNKLYTLIRSRQSFKIRRFGRKIVKNIQTIDILILLDLRSFGFLKKYFFLKPNLNILVIYIRVSSLCQYLWSQFGTDCLHKLRVFFLFVSQWLGINVDTFLFSVI